MFEAVEKSIKNSFQKMNKSVPSKIGCFPEMAKTSIDERNNLYNYENRGEMNDVKQVCEFSKMKNLDGDVKKSQIRDSRAELSIIFL